jgi:ADP-heptose:LPS heptosyltransferase
MAFPTVIHPGMVFDPTGLGPRDDGAFKPFDLKEFHNQPVVTLVRTYAMGDIIQMIAVARAFKKYYNVGKVNMVCRSSYHVDLKPLYPDITWFTESYTIPESLGLIFSTDGSDKDHSIVHPNRKLHRVKIAFNLLGIDIEPTPENLDFSPGPMKPFEGEMSTEKKIIGLQIRGSGALKSLPTEFVKRLSMVLGKKYQVILLDQDRGRGWTAPGVADFTGKLTVYQCVALLQKIHCVITMDSGMLWLAHAAKCPTLTMLGPTRESERLSLHPLYPNKAKSISISEMIGCEPCFETRVRCKGAINCMKRFDQERLLAKIDEKLTEILEA